MAKAEAMAPVPMRDLAPNPVVTVRPVRRIPMVVQPTPVVALVAISRAATGPNAVHVLPSKAWRTTMMRNPPSILKTITSPVPTRIWAPKAVSTPLATNQVAAQAVNPTRP